MVLLQGSLQLAQTRVGSNRSSTTRRSRYSLSRGSYTLDAGMPGATKPEAGRSRSLLHTISGLRHTRTCVRAASQYTYGCRQRVAPALQFSDSKDFFSLSKDRATPGSTASAPLIWRLQGMKRLLRFSLGHQLGAVSQFGKQLQTRRIEACILIASMPKTWTGDTTHTHCTQGRTGLQCHTL